MPGHGCPNGIKAGQKVLVAGLGKSGFAAVKFLKTLGAEVLVSDSSSIEKIDQEAMAWLDREKVFVETGRHSPELFLSADVILASPGIPLDTEALAAAGKAGVPVIGELALASFYLKTPVIAVTGSNGKSTVTSLLGCLFEASGKKTFVGGNIGIPLTEYLVGPQDAEVAVLEVSSFQLDSACGFRPDIGVLLNISPDHLDRYASYEHYAQSKFGMFAFQTEKDAAVFNVDDPEVMKRLSEKMRGRNYFFGAHLGGRRGITSEGQKIVLPAIIDDMKDREVYDLAGTSLSHQPNINNAMAAIMAARLMGCSAEGIRKGLALYRPLQHRLALVAEIEGVQYYDDSKATNTGAVNAALSSFDQPVVLIAGGREKGEDYGVMAEMVAKKVTHLLLIGEARETMARKFEKLTTTEKIETLESAVNRAHEIARPGDIVLLSPACASFDMFSNYAHRGEVFTEKVLALKQRQERRNSNVSMEANSHSANGKAISVGH